MITCDCGKKMVSTEHSIGKRLTVLECPQHKNLEPSEHQIFRVFDPQQEIFDSYEAGGSPGL
jgi:hypothetical protein